MSETERGHAPEEAGSRKRLQEMNEALLRSAVHQQELAEAAERTSAALRENQRVLQGQLDDTELLRSLSAEMVGEGSVEVLYGKIVDTAAALMHSDFASMQMLHPERGERGELHLLAQRGFTAEASRRWQWVCAGHKTTCGVALATGKRSIVADIESCAFLAGTADLDAYRQTGVRSVQSTPLLSRAGKQIGMLSTHWREPHEPSERDLHLFDLLVRQAADLVDRRQADEALRQSEAEARRLFELIRSTTTSMNEGLYTVDAEGRATSVNPEAERLLGWEAGELLGRSMHATIHYEHPDGSPFPAEECPGLQVLRSGKALKDSESAFIRKDGSVLPVSYSSAPLRDPGGAIVGLVVVFQDIRERKRAREELTRAAEELADVNRRKDEFLAMLSHELRNPLAPIRAAVHIMKTQERGSENRLQQQAREIIERQVGNLNKLVSDLLEVARVVSGRVRLDLQIVDLNEVVRHAVEASRQFVDQQMHTLTLKLCDGEVWVHADGTRLEEVLVNILDNAAKYTPKGGHIEVRCEQPSGTNDARVRVRDDGVGIEEGLLRGGRIFDLFTQADRSLARSAGGLGIGLSLAHRLVSLHGGSIDVRSPPEGADKGSEFTLRLPLVSSPTVLAVEAPGAPRPRRKRLRILVVDDNADLVTMLGTALREEGHGIQSARSGPDGLRVAREWRPDVVLLDIGLPGLDGYEVARRLRADPTLRSAGTRMRLVAVTGYGRDTDLALAREAGFDAHLTKPVDFGDLERLLRAAAPQAPAPDLRG